MIEILQVLQRHFKDGSCEDIHDYIYHHGDVLQAVLLFKVFNPEFAEVDGNIVLKSYIDEEGGTENLQALLEAKEKPENEILAGYRWREVPYQFKNLGNATNEVVGCLANLMAQSWWSALALNYPNQEWNTFTISPELTGDCIGVGFEPVT